VTLAADDRELPPSSSGAVRTERVGLPTLMYIPDRAASPESFAATT